MKKLIKLMKSKSKVNNKPKKKIMKINMKCRKKISYIQKINESKKFNIMKLKNSSFKIKSQYIKLIEGSKSLRKIMNKRIKTINGNIKKNCINIINWNKGPMHISKKMNDIKETLEKYKPKIMVINELNYNFDDDENMIKIDKYSFEVDNLRENNKTGRTGMYIRNDMAYTRAKYLEDIDTSCVAIRIGFPNRKSLLSQVIIGSGMS